MLQARDEQTAGGSLTTPDIFISYAHADEPVARRFAVALADEGLNVWWDAALRSGEAWDEVLEAALRGAKAVVVLWSPRSAVSRWVRAEATIADRQKTLVPATIEPCERPIMFELTQTADLSRWVGDRGDPAWQGFVADLWRTLERASEKAGSAAPPAPIPVTASPPGHGSSGARLHHTRPSIAIMPFTNRSEERADAVFAGGMGEDIAGALSLGRGLRVISQGATMAYLGRGVDLRRIGEDLGAKYIMEGNVRRVGPALRVTAQLVEAENGAILWTQKFDRPLEELAELQEELVEELAAHLGVQISRIEMERALRKPGDINAWEAMMRSWAAYARFTPESMEVAQAEARRAVELAPDYAVARGTLAMGLALLYAVNGARDRGMIEEAVSHAELALALNPNHATVLFQVVNTFGNAGRWDEALPLAQRAVEINPNLIDARQSLALVLIHFERYEEALFHLAEGDRLSPRAFQQVLALGHRCWALYGMGRIEEALAVVSEYLARDQNNRFPLMTRAMLLQQLGRFDDARLAIRQLRKAIPEGSLGYWLSLVTSSYLPDALKEPFAQNLAAAWEAEPKGNGE